MALLKVIGDFERISVHAVNLLESAEELRDKNLTLTEDALKEYDVITEELGSKKTGSTVIPRASAPGEPASGPSPDPSP